MTEQIVDIVEANMPVSSDVEAAAKGAGAAAGEYAGRQAANASLADVRALADTNKSRLDTLVAAPASGNTELVDVRVDVNGVTHKTAGDAVRSQAANAISAAKLFRTATVDAPYDDFDTVPPQSIVTYSNLTNVAHTPAGTVAGTLITYEGETGVKSARTQIFTDLNDGLYWRLTKGRAFVWGSWSKLVTADMVHADRMVLPADLAAPYDDLDTLPTQSIVTYAVPFANVDHSPSGFNGGTVVTLEGKTGAKAGRIQAVVSNGGQLAWRIMWGSNPLWGQWRILDTDAIANAQDYWSSLSLFERIGVIGDSYASGEIVLNGYHDCYPLSWGQIIARRNGIHCTNYSSGGLTTRAWLTHAKGLQLLQSSEADNLYLLALGINDCEKLGADYLGSVSDMHDDASTNPDTYYGNYGRIIAAIKTKNPRAKIVIMTMARTTGGNYPAYNTAIEAIAAQAGIPCIHQSDDPFFQSAFYRTMLGGHPVGVTYAGMATAIERLFSRCAINHIQYFQDYMG